MDVVYPLKPEGPYEELRYSLRSLRHLPHRSVFTAGGKADWFRGETIETEPQPTKHLDSTNNLRAACLDDRVSDPFVLMNDDFFILRAVPGIPVLNRGPAQDLLVQYNRQNLPRSYVEGARATLKVLKQEGWPDPLSFELHVPLLVHKSYMLAAIRIGESYPVWHKRTAYGALAGLTGETVSDVKVRDRKTGLGAEAMFVSTQDESFQAGIVGQQIRSMFPDPSPYETP